MEGNAMNHEQPEDLVLTIYGTTEAAEYLHEVTGQPWDARKVAKYVDRSRDRGFPPGAFPGPDVQLRCGSIWIKDTLDDYLSHRKQPE